ncbi:MAG: M55 family metallopeptidase [Planctomycetes bacterium]|nr:M55 family metallopeptidase [Planctomycetota bacterium]
MKIFVMVDMEGISGIFRSSQVMSDGEHYQTGRKYMTWDVNACVEGCFAGGATKVVVRDAHSRSGNFIWHELDSRGEYVIGRSPRERMPGIAGFDGLILLGYHAMAGTPYAILEHTWSSKGWQNFWMNGVKCGEIAIDAGIAGDHGVPTIMVSGDDKLRKETRKFLPGAVTVQVKKGLGIQGGQMLSMERAHALITEGAAKAVAKCSKIKPFKVKSPVRMRLEVVSRGNVPANRPDVKVIDGRTYEVTAPSVEEALKAL